MAISARPELRDLPPCVHGAISEVEAAAEGRPVIDFSVNSNPLGPSPRALQAFAAANVSRYPDPEVTALRQALAGGLGVPADAIIAGNGSAELIWLAALAFLRPGDRALIVGPTFGEYERAVRIMGAEAAAVNAKPEDGFRPPMDEAVRHIAEHRLRLAFLCNPNNPTGAYLRRGAVERLQGACGDTLLIVDEAYLTFVDAPDSLLDLLPGGNLLLLRSMTKDGALAGLRLGYALAAPPIIEALKAVRPPWSTNAAALAAGLASLADTEHMERSRRAASEARTYLIEHVGALGLPVQPSAANFLLVDVSEAPRPARDGVEGAGARWRTALLRRGCCVRDCASFGLPGFIRIGVRPLPECETLVKAMREVLANG